MCHQKLLKYLLTVLVLWSTSAILADEPPLEKLLQDLVGPDKRAQAVARQLLPRQGVKAVPELIPLLTHEKPAIIRISFDILKDISNESCSPGREAERKKVTDHVVALVSPNRSENERIMGLKLLERLVPEGYDVSPIAAMLKEKPVLRDKARTALQRIGTPQAGTALRNALDNADPEFQCSLLNSLGEMEDQASLEAIKKLTKSSNAKVRAAAARALAWTHDPDNLAVVKSVLNAADDATRFEAMDALLRLTNTIEAKGGNWQVVRNSYLEILKIGQGVQKDAALAGLGRIGDGSCVEPVLAAIKNVGNPTWLVGIDALKKMQGIDVARAIVKAFPTLAPKTQMALLPSLGEKKTSLVVPVLQQAAQSQDSAFRLAALKGLSQLAMEKGLQTLVVAAEKGSNEEKVIAIEGILNIADTLRGTKKKEEASKAYLAALKFTNDKQLLTRALKGVAACPNGSAFDAVMAVADNKDLKQPSLRALMAVADSLAAAGEKDKALAAYRKIPQLGPSAEEALQLIERMRKLDVEVDLTAMLGVVTNWRLAGPFELGDQNKGWGAKLVNEPDIQLDASYQSGNQQISWKRVTQTNHRGVINLLNAIAARENCVAYAYAEIQVEKETKAELRIGSDDSVRVWFNGELIHKKFESRGVKIDQDRLPVTLKAGTNRILVKILQLNGGWAFCMRVTTPEGIPVNFVQKTK